MVKRFHRLSPLILLVAGLALSGCSTIYQQKWKRAQRDAASTEGVTGAWEGRWRSDVNQHEGKLRCIVTKTAETDYDFHFWATWSVFAGTYHVKAPDFVSENGGASHFKGSKNLGRLTGGVYTFSGDIDGDEFEARYESRIDQGIFSLKRAVRAE